MGGWSWDSRLATIASSFAVHHAVNARAAADRALITVWAADTIRSAPARVRAIAEQYDGVRKEQLLLTGGNVDSLLAFGLWWPWEMSATISLRVGLADVDESRSQHARFRAIFGVSL